MYSLAAWLTYWLRGICKTTDMTRTSLEIFFWTTDYSPLHDAEMYSYGAVGKSGCGGWASNKSHIYYIIIILIKLRFHSELSSHVLHSTVSTRYSFFMLTLIAHNVVFNSCMVYLKVQSLVPYFSILYTRHLSSIISSMPGIFNFPFHFSSWILNFCRHYESLPFHT